MARYLIIEGEEVVTEVEATSVGQALEGIREGLFTVYTLQGGGRAVRVHAVTKTQVTFVPDEEAE